MTSHLTSDQRNRVKEYLLDALDCVNAYAAVEGDPEMRDHLHALDIVLLENCHYALMVASAAAPGTQES